MDYSLDYGTSMGIFGFLTGGMLMFMLGFAIVILVAHWKVFEKAGVEGIKAIIPILNTWEMFKIAGLNPLLILLMLIPGVNGIIAIFLAYKFTESYGFSVGGFLLYIFFTPLVALYMGFSDNVEYVGNYYEG